MTDNPKILDKDVLFFTQKLLNLIDISFNEILTETLSWLREESTQDFYYKQKERLSDFYETSGIRDEWDTIVRKRAIMGADLIEEVYSYARNLGRESQLVAYTTREQMVLNKLCDNTYELIKGVTEDQISGIRRQLIEDYFEGTHPTGTSIKQHLDEIKLEPIRGFSPEKRAEMIARTEIRTAMNTAQLELYKEQGVEFVERTASPTACKDCEDEDGTVYPIDEAINKPLMHPQCNCGWSPVKRELSGYYQTAL